MAFLLDTNVLSELRRKDRCDGRVAEWQEGVSTESCHVSVISFLEIRRGISMTRRKDRDFAEVLDDWYRTRVLLVFGRRSLPVGMDVAEVGGELMAVRTRGWADALIAATALVHGLTLVTRNTADFDDEGLRVVNPWLG